MPRVTGSIPNLFNGVSQQTPALRLPTQGAQQLNMYPSLVQGLVKRPPLEIINDDIKGQHLDLKGTTHLVDRGGDSGSRERCFIYVTPKGITAFRPDGTQKTVNHANEGLQYLAKGGTHRYAIMTIADYTFISNPTVKVKLGNATSAPGNNCGIVVVKQAAYDTEYKIDVTVRQKSTGEKQTYTSKVKTWSSVGMDGNAPDKITVGWIVTHLVWNFLCEGEKEEEQQEEEQPWGDGNYSYGIGDNEHDGDDQWGSSGSRAIFDWLLDQARKKKKEMEQGGGTGQGDEGTTTETEDDYGLNWDKCILRVLPFVVHKAGNVIYICPKEGYEILNLHVDDSEGGQLMRAILGKTARFSDLPARAVDGTIIKITGDDTTRFNDYYVMFRADPERYDPQYFIQEGSWEECPAPNIKISLDPYTMPHVLIDKGDSFLFKPCFDWADRIAGDDDTCPIPEFVDGPITGLFQYRNRLGFLSEDIVALSEASQYFNWWNTTAMTQVDSDPIYLSASVEGAPTLRWAVPFNEEVILFSDRAQFKLAAPEVLSPATAAVNTVTNYSTNPDIKPVSNGRNIFFTDTQEFTALSKSTRVYEYYLDSDTGSKAAMEVTAHVPQYVPSKVTDMACSPGLNLLVLYRQGHYGMWLYKYYWSGNDKLQAAWFEFAFGTGEKLRCVLGAEFIGDVLYCLMWSLNRYKLCKIDFSITLDETTEPTPDAEPQGPEPFPVYLDMKAPFVVKGYYDFREDETEVPIPSYYNPETVAIIDRTTYRELRPARVKDGMMIYKGDVSNVANCIIGERYPSVYTFSPAFIRGGGQDGQGQLTSHMGRLQLQHWRIIMGPTGYLQAQVLHEDGNVWVYDTTHILTNFPRQLLGRMNTNELTALDFPVRADSRVVTIRIENPTWFPSTVISAEWDANYITKGRQHL